MKINVKDKLAVIFTSLVYSAPRTAMYFAGSYLGAAILLPVILQRPLEENSFWVGLISFGVLAVVIARQVVDSLLHAKNTSVELTPSSIDCEISGFTTETFSIPLDQISNVRVSQAFMDKFFGVSSIVISQIAGTFAVYGFEYEDAKKFAKEYSMMQSSKKSRQIS